MFKKIKVIVNLMLAGMLVCGSCLAQQKDEVNFQVGNGSNSKDPNLYDSIFFSLEEASKAPLRVSELSLEGKKLTQFPPAILTFKNLHTLNISYNRIDSIPASLFDKCRKLHTLQYAGNGLNKLPVTVFNPALKVLDVSENNLTIIPEGISKCVQLEELDLHSNQLTSYPSAFVLKKLKSLILSGNPIATIDSWVIHQPALKILFIDNTKIEKLPDGICKMSALRFLTIEENGIKELPSCFCELKQLKILMVSGSALANDKLKEVQDCLPELQVR